MSASEALKALAATTPIPRDKDGPVFPTASAARAFALAVALNERGVFAWHEWARALGAAIVRDARSPDGDTDAYWRAWLTALEDILAQKQVADRAALLDLQDAWRRAAAATPHGQPIELRRDPQPRRR